MTNHEGQVLINCKIAINCVWKGDLQGWKSIEKNTYLNL